MTSSRPRVTYLAPFVPFGGIPHAGGQFLHQYLLRLSESFDLTLVAPGSAVNRAAAAEPDVTPVRLHLVTVRPRPRTKVGFLPRLLANTIAGLTPGWQVLRGFRGDPEVWSLVAASDIVELSWAWYLAFLPDVRRAAPDVPITVFEPDVLTESLSRRSRHGFAHERTLGRIAALRTRSLEANLLNRCDTVFVLSERDRRLLQDLGVTKPVLVIDPLVERRPVCGPPAQPPIVLFVGALDRPENHQGAVWMIDRVWPLVERVCPEARLVLAGTSPPPALSRRASGSVSVPGFVADLSRLYREATVFVAPNLTGAGVKFKVLDAMSYGLPVVATPISAEGIVEGAIEGAFGAITDDADEMATRVVELIRNPEDGRAIGRVARQWVQEKYDFDRSIARVVGTYNWLIGR